MSLVRWGGHTFREVDDVDLAEWNAFNESLVQHPPTDFLVASYLQYKAPGKSRNLREAARENAQAIKAIPMRVQPNMPAHLCTPAKMALIEKMKSQMGVADA